MQQKIYQKALIILTFTLTWTPYCSARRRPPCWDSAPDYHSQSWCSRRFTIRCLLILSFTLTWTPYCSVHHRPPCWDSAPDYHNLSWCRRRFTIGCLLILSFTLTWAPYCSARRHTPCWDSAPDYQSIWVRQKFYHWLLINIKLHPHLNSLLFCTPPPTMLR